MTKAGCDGVCPGRARMSRCTPTGSAGLLVTYESKPRRPSRNDSASASQSWKQPGATGFTSRRRRPSPQRCSSVVAAVSLLAEALDALR
ncbi:hypothetical protein [Streptomyces clavifer]|uniref:hypothetical protein n=1 Tax=Streptomyces clavifer TaxID=68188 RepID=UPI0033A57DF1